MQNDSYRSQQRPPSLREWIRDRCSMPVPLFTALTFTMVFFLSGIHLTAQAEATGPFLGRWDLTLLGQPRNLPSWIDVTDSGGKLRLTFVGVTDHATWMKDAKIEHGELTFVSPKGQEGFDEDTTYTLKRSGQHLDGTATNSSHSWKIVGNRAPSLATDTVSHWGNPVRLFDGKDFSGWRFSDPANSHWKIEDGNLVNMGHGAEIITLAKFNNFKLHLEFNAAPMSNSGVFLRGRYEVQIETDSVSEPPSHHTGGVYGFLAPHPEQPRTPNKWQTFDITLIGRTVTIVQNGITVIDHKQIPGITGGALNSDEGEPGPIYLQGSEKGRVAFRNIVITPAAQ